MTETTDDPDVFEAYARLRGRLAADANIKSHGEFLLVSRADLQLILDVPLAHALTADAVRRAMAAINSVHRYGWGTTRERAMHAAIKAALGGPR